MISWKKSFDSHVTSALRVFTVSGMVRHAREDETMAYTIKKLAKMSGVTVRTLHFYDEAGLLKPAYYGANDYRFYEEPQLLMLQQILFYRELGFELKEIKRILSRPSFDRIAALESHRKNLRPNVARTRALIRTIDRTIEHLKGARKMKDQELFAGFSPEQQAKHQQYLIDRFGPKMKDEIAHSKRRVKDWTKADWEKSGWAFVEICRDLVGLMERRLAADSDEVQGVIRRHHRWLTQFWTPIREFSPWVRANSLSIQGCAWLSIPPSSACPSSQRR